MVQEAADQLEDIQQEVAEDIINQTVEIKELPPFPGKPQ